MLGKLLDIVLVLCLAVFVMVPVASRFAQKVGVELPKWMEVDHTRSNLEGRPYTARPGLSKKVLFEKTYQAQFDKYLADMVPMRDGVILANEKMQLTMITMANLALGYAVAPSFFGSEFSLCALNKSIYPLPIQATEENVEQLAVFGERLNRLAQEYPECNFSCFLAESINASSNNRLNSLTSNPLTHEQVIEAVSAGLDDAFRFSSIAHDSASYEDEYFRTDFHWNVNGAYRGYREAAELLGLSNVIDKGAVFACDYPVYEGSSARQAKYLDFTEDHVFDCYFDLPPYEVRVGDTSGGNELLSVLSLGNYESFPFAEGATAERYAELFPHRYQVSVIKNNECETGRTLLILGDSFARVDDRLLAAGYTTTVLFNPTTSEGSMPEMIEKYQPDDVLVLLCTKSLLVAPAYSESLMLQQ